MADEWDELYRKWGAPRQAKKKRFVSRKVIAALFSILLIFVASFLTISNFSSTNMSSGGSASSGSPAQDKGTDSPLVYSDNKSPDNSFSPQDGINKDIAINLTDFSYCGLIKSDVLKNSCNNEVSSRISAARVAEDERIHNQPPLIPRGNLSILLIGFAPKNSPLPESLQLHNYTNAAWETLTWPEYERKNISYLVENNLLQPGGNPTFKTFLYIKKWYEREAARYNITNFSLNVYTKGLFYIDEDILGINRANRFGSCNPILVNFFENITKERNIQRNYDAVIYVYFDAGPVFSSCAERYNKTAYINAEIFLIPDNEYSIRTITHELSHIFGANDKYNLNFTCDDTGIPEPNKVPKYPQNKACISCGYIMGNLSSSGNPLGSEANTINIDNEIICNKDAEEMTWK